MQGVDTDFSKYQRAKGWWQEHAAGLANWEWFKRQHRAELVSSGALLIRAGRAGDLIHTDRIVPAVQRILESESRKRIEGLCDRPLARDSGADVTRCSS